MKKEFKKVRRELERQGFVVVKTGTNGHVSFTKDGVTICPGMNCKDAKKQIKLCLQDYRRELAKQ